MHPVHEVSMNPIQTDLLGELDDTECWQMDCASMYRRNRIQQRGRGQHAAATTIQCPTRSSLNKLPSYVTTFALWCLPHSSWQLPDDIFQALHFQFTHNQVRLAMLRS